MTKTINDLKKAALGLLSLLIVFGVLFLVSCDNGGDDDPEPELYGLPGVYEFQKAELTDGKDEIAAAIGFSPALIPSDITGPMADGLLEEAPCDDPENGAVELKESKELFFACVGEANEEKAGTWNVNADTTRLDLNLSISSGDLQLPIENLTIDEANDVLAGSISNFPITKTLVAGFLAGVPGGDVILAGLDDDLTILVDVDIEFKKVE